MNKQWYVYKITFSDSTFYIGYRGTSSIIEDDFLIKYFSSSKTVKQRIKSSETYSGEILHIFDNQEDAYDKEQEIIFELFENPLIIN